MMAEKQEDDQKSVMVCLFLGDRTSLAHTGLQADGTSVCKGVFGARVGGEHVVSRATGTTKVHHTQRLQVRVRSRVL
jgi:hypothetical protein